MEGCHLDESDFPDHPWKLVVKGSDLAAARTCSLPKIKIANKIAYGIMQGKAPQLCRWVCPVALREPLHRYWQQVNWFKSGKGMVDDVSWLELALESMIATRALLVKREHLSGGLNAAEVVKLMVCASRRLASSCRRGCFLPKRLGGCVVPVPSL